MAHVATRKELYYKARKAPHVNKLMSKLQIDRATANTIYMILTGQYDLMKSEAVREVMQLGPIYHTERDMALLAIDDLLCGRNSVGVDYIPHAQDSINSMKGIEVIHYGDATQPTIFYNHAKDTWHVESWRGFVNQNRQHFTDYH